MMRCSTSCSASKAMFFNGHQKNVSLGAKGDTPKNVSLEARVTLLDCSIRSNTRKLPG